MTVTLDDSARMLCKVYASIRQDMVLWKVWDEGQPSSKVEEAEDMSGIMPSGVSSFVHRPNVSASSGEWERMWRTGDAGSEASESRKSD